MPAKQPSLVFKEAVNNSNAYQRPRALHVLHKLVCGRVITLEETLKCVKFWRHSELKRAPRQHPRRSKGLCLLSPKRRCLRTEGRVVPWERHSRRHYLRTAVNTKGDRCRPTAEQPNFIPNLERAPYSRQCDQSLAKWVAAASLVWQSW